MILIFVRFDLNKVPKSSNPQILKILIQTMSNNITS